MKKFGGMAKRFLPGSIIAVREKMIVWSKDMFAPESERTGDLNGENLVIILAKPGIQHSYYVLTSIMLGWIDEI